MHAAPGGQRQVPFCFGNCVPAGTLAVFYRGTGRNTVPRTGDESMPVIWMLLMGFSAIGIVAVLGRKRKKN